MQPPHDTQQLPAFDPSRPGSGPHDPHRPAGPGGPHQTAGPVPGTAPRRRGLGLKIGLGVGVVLLLLVVAAIGLELGLRNSVQDRLQREASASLGSEATVDTGSGLVLPSMFTKRLSEVHISTPGTQPAPGAGGAGSDGTIAPAIDLTARGVSTEGDTTHLDSLDGRVHVSDAMMAAAASKQSGGGLMQVQSVTSDPDSGTLLADVGLAKATVRPVLEDGKVDLKPEKASFLGFELPSSVLGGTVSMMDETTSQLPRGVRVTDVTVVRGGMDLTISGTDVVLDKKR